MPKKAPVYAESSVHAGSVPGGSGSGFRPHPTTVNFCYQTLNLTYNKTFLQSGTWGSGFGIVPYFGDASGSGKADNSPTEA